VLTLHVVDREQWESCGGCQGFPSTITDAQTAEPGPLISPNFFDFDESSTSLHPWSPSNSYTIKVPQ
jgi:hypothetical protein